MIENIIGLEKLPLETIEATLALCDEKTLMVIFRVCKTFEKVMSQSNDIDLQKIALVYAIGRADYQLREISKGACSIMKGNNGKENFPTTKLTKIFINNCNEYQQLKEKFIDALSDINMPDWGDPEKDTKYVSLEKLDPNTFTITDSIKQIFESAKKRDNGIIAPIGRQLIAVANEEIDDQCGRIYGNYGLDDGWHASIEVTVVSQKYDPWFAHGKIDCYLPVQLFFGKNEGDVISLSINGRDIKLLCSTQFESEWNLTFQDNFKNSLKNPTFYWPPKLNSDLSREEQEKLCEEARQNYKKFT